MKKKSVILFYFGELPEDFTSELNPYYTLHTIPVLTFTFSEYAGTLTNFDFKPYDCIVFPSKRAVEALHNQSIQLPNTLICSVGDSTSNQIRSLLNIEPNITGSQGAHFLACEIVSIGTVKSLLYLSGTNQSTLPAEVFKSAQIEVTELVCYGTKPVSRESLLESVQNIQTPDICIFFSPSGVKTVSHSIQWPWDSMTLISIGQTTSASIQEQFSLVPMQPDSSNLSSIKDLLLSIL